MAKMTQEQVIACYELAKEFYENKISITEAVAELVDKHGMNEASAIMYIHFFKYMMNNKKYTHAISTAGLEYYLKNVLEDYGKEQLEIFLQGLEKHIEYRHSRKQTAQSFCDLYNKYSKEIGLSQRL